MTKGESKLSIKVKGPLAEKVAKQTINPKATGAYVRKKI